MTKLPKRKLRDSSATKARILSAAKVEFAKKGLGGARVDDIAARSKTNKRMMYHYFGNKEELFRITLEEAYSDIRNAELSLELDKLDPIAALKANIAFVWQYYLDNPEFLTLVNSENLHQARHIKKSTRIRELSRPFVDRMHHLLERGVAAGQFRGDCDAVQLNITIAAVGYYYLTNRFTGSVVFERDLMTNKALAERLGHNTKTILRLVCTPEALARIEASP
jgi:AcrR family transcriptional regulator